MINKYPNEMIDPRILDEHAKDAQRLNGRVNKVDDTGLGDQYGYAPNRDEYKAETPYVEKQFSFEKYDQMQLDRAINNNADSGEYCSEAMARWVGERGPFDFSLEKELANINKEEYIDMVDVWKPNEVNGNGATYAVNTHHPRHQYMGRHISQIRGNLKHPINTPSGMGSAYSEALDDDSVVVHLNFGNPYTGVAACLSAEDTKAKDIDEPITDADLPHHYERRVLSGRHMVPGLKNVVNPANDKFLSEPKPREEPVKPTRLAVIGNTPKAQMAYIVAACQDAGIEVAERIDYSELDIIGNPDMRKLSAAALSLKHINATPYASGKPREDSELTINRKLSRNAQQRINDQNGYGKRLTKKARLELEAKNKYVETIVTTRKDVITIKSSD